MTELDRYPGMERTEQLTELARCIQEHNALSRSARDLWAQAQAQSRAG
ncbi:hypothetical protein [Streptomyces jumonjinensis]|nr:hypothetical protein [Streptomyces jumonjinensis]